MQCPLPLLNFQYYGTPAVQECMQAIMRKVVIAYGVPSTCMHARLMLDPAD